MNSDARSPAWTLHESATSSVVIHVPHAGVAIPDDVRSGLLLTDDELREELAAMTDHRTDAIASAAAAVCDVSVIANRLSRLVVDPERFPDEREEMLAVGMGAVYTQTSRRQPLRHADAERDARLLAEYFVPYSAAVAALVERVLDRHGTCTIIDLHSYPTEPLPYELRPAAHRPGTCIGTDSVHTPEHLRDAALAAFADVGGGAAVDTPFSGTYVPTQHFRHDMRVTSVMIEIRRDLYADERGAADDRDIAALATRLARLAGTAARAQ
ncbi:MAG: N-formylglutamate amidohydrolase [Ilumatobacteraceae bacterium]